MAKLSDRAQDQPLQLCQVLLEELRHLRPHAPGFRTSGFTGPRCLVDLFKLVHSWSAEKGAAAPVAGEESDKGREQVEQMEQVRATAGAGKPAEGAAGKREAAKEASKEEAKEVTETSGAGTVMTSRGTPATLAGTAFISTEEG